MKKTKYLLFIIIISLLSCSQNLPETYGIYAYTDKGRVALSGQKIYFAGNLMQSFTGLKGASGSGYSSIKYFIIFDKEINPKSIRLSKLAYKKGGNVQGIWGDTYVDVNLWSATKHIDIDIAPIDGKKDMYKLIPKEKLMEGFYALHFGGLENISTIEASVGNTAFDFVIGKNDDYLSQEVLKKRSEEKIKSEAENLLTNMNLYFNNRNYAMMKEIYRPDGRVLSDIEWHDFTKGLSAWLNNAGKITDSKIVNYNITDKESSFQIQTTYERKGQQTERLVVKNINGKYYVTSLE